MFVYQFNWITTKYFSIPPQTVCWAEEEEKKCIKTDRHIFHRNFRFVFFSSIIWPWNWQNITWCIWHSGRFNRRDDRIESCQILKYALRKSKLDKLRICMQHKCEFMLCLWSTSCYHDIISKKRLIQASGGSSQHFFCVCVQSYRSWINVNKA